MYNSFRNCCERLLRIPRDPESPPGDEASMRLFRAAPQFYKYLLVLWGVKSLAALFVISWIAIAPAAGAFALTKRGHHSGLLLLFIPGVFGMLVVLLRLFALALVRIDFEKRWYLVTDRSLRVREGIVGVREMTVTFANIQNISISQGPVQRLLGIADLRVDTAGGGAVNDTKHPGMNLHTAWFRGVSNATEVRELIQQRLREFKDAGLGDHEEQATRESSNSPPVSADFIAALRALRDEASALRQTVSVIKAPTVR